MKQVLVSDSGEESYYEYEMVTDNEDGEDEWEDTSTFLRNVANNVKRPKVPKVKINTVAKDGGGVLASNDLMKKLRSHDFKLDLRTKDN